ncbi:MAG: hypothetical protein KJT03_09415 [Verrucomicrobiae bacterium]|nr:hypothetical protein [Verrucomicrobiae bacterium]
MPNSDIPASRGAVYLYWGTQPEEEMKRSVESLKRFHPELPVRQIKLKDGSSLLDKSSMLKLSPFESTLFLDTDTVVLDRLDFGFDQAERHGLACCINECPWARRYADIGGDQVEYNTGVLFFTKKANQVFNRWDEISHTIDSTLVFYQNESPRIMPFNDQAGFSQAIVDTGINPFVLPLNWNFRPMWHRSFFGPIKIWHDRTTPPPTMERWNEDQSMEPSILKYSGNLHWMDAS